MSKVVDRDLGYANLMARLMEQNSIDISIGILPDGETGDDGMYHAGTELAFIASINEFGSSDGHVPERSFLRSTIDENRNKYLRLMTTATKQVMRGVSAKVAYSSVARKVVRDVVRKIKNRIPPANAAATIKKKKSDVPLVDTGELYASISYRLKGL